jgi:transcriptional coactivator HFI1/ADA1
LVLGLLYNASADVPGPSSTRTGQNHHKRDANGTLVGLDEETKDSVSDDDEPMHRILAPPEKRLRVLTAGLSRKDRARIKNIPKTMTHTRGSTSGATSSLGWAGAGADMLEKKRKDEEKKRSIEEKKRVKEVYTQIGAKDWKSQILAGSAQVASVHDRLSLSECWEWTEEDSILVKSSGCGKLTAVGLGYFQQLNKRLQELWQLLCASSQSNYLIWTLCET